jgi:hypothetical protein
VGRGRLQASAFYFEGVFMPTTRKSNSGPLSGKKVAILDEFTKAVQVQPQEQEALAS